MTYYKSYLVIQSDFLSILDNGKYIDGPRGKAVLTQTLSTKLS